MQKNDSSRRRAVCWVLSVACAGLAGCAASTPPAPPRVPVPPPGDGPVREHMSRRPIGNPNANALMPPTPPPMYRDAPLVSQAPPEQAGYLAAYAGVGRPRVVVFVNRSVEGNLIPVSDQRGVWGVTYRETDGSNVRTEEAEVYLAPGQYDDAQAQRIDYDALETVLTDWMGAQGRVTLVSPTMARTRLSDQDVKEMTEGRPQVLREIAEKLDADVLILVQAKPTKQTSDGLYIRVLCEAINTKGGESIARAFVDVPPPLDKGQLNYYTRYLSRKLMMELTGSWEMLAREPARQQQQPETPQPQPQQPPVQSRPPIPVPPPTTR